MKKKMMIVLGAFVLLLGMGLNLQNALDDYGLANGGLVVSAWAAITGGDDGGTGDLEGYKCSAKLTCNDENGKENGFVFCKGKKTCMRSTFSGYVQCDEDSAIYCN